MNHLPGWQELTQLAQAGVFTETAYAGMGFVLGFSVMLDPTTYAALIDSCRSIWIVVFWRGTSSGVAQSYQAPWHPQCQRMTPGPPPRQCLITTI